MSSIACEHRRLGKRSILGVAGGGDRGTVDLVARAVLVWEHRIYHSMVNQVEIHAQMLLQLIVLGISWDFIMHFISLLGSWTSRIREAFNRRRNARFAHNPFKVAVMAK